MSTTTTEPDPHLLEIAELRARGSSWEAVAGRLDADPDDLKRQARDAGPAYRRAFNTARREVVDEACGEALFALRRALRSDDERASRLAADTILKLRMTELRHRRKGKPAAPPDPPLSPRAQEAVRFIAAHTDEELDELWREFRDDLLPPPNEPTPPPSPPPRGEGRKTGATRLGPPSPRGGGG